MSKHVEIIEIHIFDHLVPFGSVKIRLDKVRRSWHAQCAHYHLSGSGVNVDKIVQMFEEVSFAQGKTQS